MEDIVKNVVDEILRNDKDMANVRVNRDDIIAYVLNRIPARYVTSERGILHGQLKAHYRTQERTDIIMCVYEGIDVIKGRRETAAASTRLAGGGKIFPRVAHILGEVLEETTLSMIPNVKVTLLFNGKPVPMLDSNWKNPCVTNKATRSYYHFWPEYNEKLMKGHSEISFVLDFSHPKFQTKRIDINVQVLKDAEAPGSFVLPIVLLEAKDGVNLDFLYTGDKD
jgi:hypothetical protein